MPQLTDFNKGIALIVVAVIMTSTALDLMVTHDEAEKEYERECDLQYRSLIGNTSTPDAELCSELDVNRSRLATKFFGALALSTVVSLTGVVMLFPSEEGGGSRPPPLG